MSTDRPFKGNSIREQLKDYTVIDLETTGIYVTSCEIIEMAAIQVRDGKITNQFSSFVKPKTRLHAEITRITGITENMLIDAPPIADVLPAYISFIGSDIILGHNITSFDANLIYDACELLGLPTFDNTMLDTYHYARCCDIDVPDYSLSTIADFFGIRFDAHRALNDCIANHQCYEFLKSVFTGCYHSTAFKQKNCSSFIKPRLSDATASIKSMLDIINVILSDNVLADEEILFLNNWLHEHENLADNYPFDTVIQAVSNVLNDGIITESERASLSKLLAECSDPISSSSCSCKSFIDFKDKKICLTGDFEFGTRDQVTKAFEAIGATVISTVTGKTNYLIVGGFGSDKWACGNYGTKVKKALELQAAGKDIMIVKENDLIQFLPDKFSCELTRM